MPRRLGFFRAILILTRAIRRRLGPAGTAAHFNLPEERPLCPSPSAAFFSFCLPSVPAVAAPPAELSRAGRGQPRALDRGQAEAVRERTARKRREIARKKGGQPRFVPALARIKHFCFLRGHVSRAFVPRHCNTGVGNTAGGSFEFPETRSSAVYSENEDRETSRRKLLRARATHSKATSKLR